MLPTSVRCKSLAGGHFTESPKYGAYKAARETIINYTTIPGSGNGLESLNKFGHIDIMACRFPFHPDVRSYHLLTKCFISYRRGILSEENSPRSSNAPQIHRHSPGLALLPFSFAQVREGFETNETGRHGPRRRRLQPRRQGQSRLVDCPHRHQVHEG